MSRTHKKVKFTTETGRILSGILDLPPGDPFLFGVFGPCFTCPKEQHAAFKTCRALSESGAAMLRIDTSGTGESEGDLSDTTFTTRIHDLIAACHFLAVEYQPPKILVGHSISGTAALTAQKYLPSLQALATIGSPCDPVHTIEKFKRNGQMHVVPGGVEIDVLGRRYFFKEGFVEDMLSQSVEKDTRSYTGKLFIFHAPHDAIVSFSEAEEIYARAANSADAELVRLDDEATHLFENRLDDAAFVAATIMDWARLHLR